MPAPEFPFSFGNVQFLLPLFLLAVSSQSLDELMHSGLAAMASGHSQKAQLDLQAAAKVAPNNPEVWLALAQVYAQDHDFASRDAAVARCLVLAHAVPNWEQTASIRDYLGKVLLAKGAFDAALGEYRQAVALDPYDESLRFDLARALLGHELFSEAIDVLTDARSVFDKSPQIELALGTAYYGQRLFPQAVTSFLRVTDLDPAIPQPYVFLGKMLDQSDDRLPEIAKRFGAFAVANPGNYLGYLLQAKALAQPGGDPMEIQTLLRHAIALNPSNWESHYELGAALDGVHVYAEAARELERSLELNPRVAATHYRLARVYDRLHRPADAAKQRKLHQELSGPGKGMEPPR